MPKGLYDEWLPIEGEIPSGSTSRGPGYRWWMRRPDQDRNCEVDPSEIWISGFLESWTAGRCGGWPGMAMGQPNQAFKPMAPKGTQVCLDKQIRFCQNRTCVVRQRRGCLRGVDLGAFLGNFAETRFSQGLWLSLVATNKILAICLSAAST